MIYFSRMLLLLLISFSTIAATTQKEIISQPLIQLETPAVNPHVANKIEVKKLNFLQRIMFKLAIRQMRADDTVTADKQANLSLIFGISAMALLFVPALAASLGLLYILSIPAAIIAMVLGKHALNAGTKETAKAKLGRGFGLATIIVLVVGVVIAAIALSAW